jgi:hypothetical protein
MKQEEELEIFCSGNCITCGRGVVLSETRHAEVANSTSDSREMAKKVKKNYIVLNSHALEILL